MSTTTLIILTIVAWGIGSFLYKPANENMHPIMVSIYVVAIPFAFLFLKFDKRINTTGIIFSLCHQERLTVLSYVGTLAVLVLLLKIMSSVPGADLAANFLE